MQEAREAVCCLWKSMHDEVQNTQLSERQDAVAPCLSHSFKNLFKVSGTRLHHFQKPEGLLLTVFQSDFGLIQLASSAFGQLF